MAITEFRQQIIMEVEQGICRSPLNLLAKLRKIDEVIKCVHDNVGVFILTFSLKGTRAEHPTMHENVG